MKKYEIAIVDSNVKDALTLQSIIINHCMDLVNIKYFSDIESAIANIYIKKPEIIILDAIFYRDSMFNFYNLFIQNEIKVLFIESKESNILTNIEKKSFNFIDKPYKTEQVITALNKSLNIKKEFNEVDSLAQLDLVTIASLNKIDFVDTKNIIFCVADGKYTTFHLINGAKIISSKNLGEYEKILNDMFFFRVHHGYIINIKYLKCIVKNEGAYCKLVNDISIPIARRKQSHFNKFIKLN